jgi:NitT/TauT family transport system permease protein
LIYLTYPIPKVVFLPIILLAMGLGDASKIFFIALILFYQVLIVVRDSAAGIHPDLVQSVASLGATRAQLVRYVYYPACVPAVLTGLRLSTGTAIAVLFLAESIAASSGVGYYIMVEGWGRMAYADMYAGVVALSALGLLLYAALDALETRLCAWRTPPGTYVS